ncbi:MAG: GMC family oxidoreductase N-terminal domain-containing protein [Actinomycetota bacterium]|nr:GMC family oxidoreductase N-terminal domain-containing protein [Actinomycetota bacterium]
MSGYDHVVVGVGSAGCVVAARLFENEDNRALLLEAGKYDSSVENVHGPPAWPALWGTEVDWAFETTPQPGTGNLSRNWPRGKVLGGSSSTNAMVYLRGHRNDFDNWAPLRVLPAGATRASCRTSRIWRRPRVARSTGGRAVRCNPR